MAELIHFTETDQAREYEFTRAEMRALCRARHGLNVTQIDDRQDSALVRVGPRIGFAGSVALPGGRGIVVHPKARINSVPEMLALAYRTLAPPPSAGVTSTTDAPPSDWLLVQLAHEVNALMASGLRRGYVERREQLPFVRGRTYPVTNPAKLPFLDCEYTDFVVDTPVNRLLRSALEVLAPAVHNRSVRRMYDDALHQLSHVEPTRLDAAQFDQIQLTRLNRHYLPSLRLARLALEGSGVTDLTGPLTAPAFFVRMWQVWENCVQSALNDAGVSPLRAKPRYREPVAYVSGEPKLPVTLEPDLIIGPRTHPELVIDLKWGPSLVKNRSGKLSFNNSHLYQIGTYTTALGCDGILLYPQMTTPVDTTYSFNGHKITIRTVDLSAPNLAHLRATAEQVAEGIQLKA